MPTKSLTRASRGVLAGFAALVLVMSCTPGWATSTSAPPPKPLAPCAWWYGIGEPPTATELELAATRYDVVVLDATETAAMRRLRELNPTFVAHVQQINPDGDADLPDEELAGFQMALVAFDGKLASMILERKDLTVGAIRKDISLRMGKQRTYFSNLVRSNASAIKILEKAKELSLEKKNKQITPEIILYAMNDSNDAWVNLVLSSFQRSW